MFSHAAVKRGPTNKYSKQNVVNLKRWLYFQSIHIDICLGILIFFLFLAPPLFCTWLRCSIRWGFFSEFMVAQQNLKKWIQIFNSVSLPFSGKEGGISNLFLNNCLFFFMCKSIMTNELFSLIWNTENYQKFSW